MVAKVFNGMKFTPRLPTENVNAPKSHPLIDLAWMTGGLILLCLLVFGALGLTVDLVIDHLPSRVEGWLGDYARRQFPAQEETPLQRRLDALVAVLPADSTLRGQSFRALLSDDPQINAVALPGNTIIVFAGLLRAVESENELSMVLAHELGHFAHRDHLRQLGRGLTLTALSAMLFGENSAATELVSDLFLTWQAGYSRQQEAAADLYALELLVARYGQAAGATDLFTHLAAEMKSRPTYLLASHPYPEKRIEILRTIIARRHYPVAERSPLEADLADLLEGTHPDPSTTP